MLARLVLSSSRGSANQVGRAHFLPTALIWVAAIAGPLSEFSAFDLCSEEFVDQRFEARLPVTCLMSESERCCHTADASAVVPTSRKSKFVCEGKMNVRRTPTKFGFRSTD